VCGGDAAFLSNYFDHLLKVETDLLLCIAYQKQVTNRCRKTTLIRWKLQALYKSVLID